MAGIGPPAACDYREGAWVHDPAAKAPYRLGREFDSNPFVKGWKYAYRSFWGLCDAELPRNVSRRSTQYHWQPSSCNLRRFSAPRFCSQFVRPGVQRDIVMAGDSFTGQLFVSNPNPTPNPNPKPKRKPNPSPGPNLTRSQASSSSRSSRCSAAPSCASTCPSGARSTTAAPTCTTCRRRSSTSTRSRASRPRRCPACASGGPTPRADRAASTRCGSR